MNCCLICTQTATIFTSALKTQGKDQIWKIIKVRVLFQRMNKRLLYLAQTFTHCKLQTQPSGREFSTIPQSHFFKVLSVFLFHCICPAGK